MIGKSFLDTVPKETSWKTHAWLCVPSPGTVFSLGCETGIGSCSVSLDQGQVNCSLRLKIKLPSQTQNTKHLTRKRKAVEIPLSWGISYWSYEVSESLICIYVHRYLYIWYYGEIAERHWLCKKGLFFCVSISKLYNLNEVYFC